MKIEGQGIIVEMSHEEAVMLKKLLGSVPESDCIEKYGLSKEQADIVSSMWAVMDTHFKGK